MISFDTFFTTATTLFIFCSTIFVSLVIEQKKNPEFQAKRIKLSIIIISSLFLVFSFILYIGDIPFFIEGLNVVKSILFTCPLLPFGREIFSFDKFYLIYLSGVVACLPCGIISVCDAVVSKTQKIPHRIFLILYAMLTTIWCPYILGYFIYTHLFAVSLLLAITVSLLINFFVDFLAIFIYLIIDLEIYIRRQ